MPGKLIMWIGLLLLGVVVAGFVRGWFVFSREGSSPGDSKVKVQLAVDPDKVKADAATVKAKTAELADKATAGAKSLTTPGAEPTGPSQGAPLE